MKYIEKPFVFFNEDDDEWTDAEEDINIKSPEEDSSDDEEDFEDEEDSFEEI